MDFTTALLELLILIGISLATPGPNPIAAFTHSGVFGKKSNVGLIAGMAVGIFMMELIIGLTIESLKENETALITPSLDWNDVFSSYGVDDISHKSEYPGHLRKPPKDWFQNGCYNAICQWEGMGFHHHYHESIYHSIWRWLKGDSLDCKHHNHNLYLGYDGLDFLWR